MTRERSMRINNNIAAMNAHRMYGLINQRILTSMERLSTGLRINRAADDPAGLAISEKMRAQIRGMRMASKNSSDAVSLLSTAEGALQETSNILQRMRELAIQAASDTNETGIDRAALEAEYQQLLKEINDISKKTVFNDRPLLDGSCASKLTGFATASQDVYARLLPNGNLKDGSYSLTITDDSSGNALFTLAGPDGFSATATADLSAGPYDKNHPLILNLGGVTLSFKFEKEEQIQTVADAQSVIGNMSIDYEQKGLTIQTGANQGDEFVISIDAMNTDKLFITGTSIATRQDASDAIGKMDRALNVCSTQRAMLGAAQNRLEHKINNLENTIVNLSDAESRIRDVDYALEMSNLVRNQIQMQFATAMLAQANSMPQTVLQLLQAL